MISAQYLKKSLMNSDQIFSTEAAGRGEIFLFKVMKVIQNDFRSISEEMFDESH